MRKIEIGYGWALIGGIADKFAGKGERLGEKEKRKRKKGKRAKEGWACLLYLHTHLFFASTFGVGGIITNVLILVSFFAFFSFSFPLGCSPSIIHSPSLPSPPPSFPFTLHEQTIVL